MPLPLREVLDDPSLAAADPVVLAGGDRLSRTVSWVHTSEVLNIADLLRGGELLLVGGVALETADAHERRRYLRALAARSVAGLAIETGGRLPTVPDEMIDEAEALGLPLVELRRVVRFVEVTQAINGHLIHESVRRLQLADQISHALAEAMASGAGLPELMQVLSGRTGADTELVSLTGELIAAGFARGDEPAGMHDHAVTAPVAIAGVTVAVLTLRPLPHTDLRLLDSARDRAPEVLSLALMRVRSPSHVERDVRDFLRMTVGGPTSRKRYADLAARLGVATAGPYVTVVAEFGGPAGSASIDAALRRRGRLTIAQVHEERYLAVVALGGTALSRGRRDVLTDLRSAALRPGAQVAVGPGAHDVDTIGRSMRESAAALDVLAARSLGTVVDAAELGVERLLLALGEPTVIDQFIDEQLGPLIELDRDRGSDLVDTLIAYVRHLGRKTDTAAALHLQRQSLYQRLEKIFAALGDAPSGSPQLGSLLVAAELEAARRRL
ncbi:PucR family transcriptional regulator [Pseudonocardia nigra]|uniref:PucR family transcriptional regulator n=1 Tax=Pseudonocardia nigra TaxID=1921578 RepID=UPI001C5F10F0|nr:PucR family transcriptional regulator [Pseudonocardia nigra]